MQSDTARVMHSAALSIECLEIERGHTGRFSGGLDGKSLSSLKAGSIFSLRVAEHTRR